MYKHLLEKSQVAQEEFLEFVLLFARLEYALKRTTGFVVVKRGSVNADWDEFGRELNPFFDRTQSDDLCHGIEYLGELPPLRQVLKDGELDFVQLECREKEPFLIQLFDSIRVVRNNLFHGGKFPQGDVVDPARNSQLLQSASVVLMECLRLARSSERPRLKNVYLAFHDGLE